MKKSKFYFLVCVLSLSFFACKKGEDDPAITLLTRKARLEGKWNMVGGSMTIGFKDSTGAYAARIYTFDESRYTYVETGLGATFEADYYLKLSFTKKGGVTIDQKMDSFKIASSGTWDFQGKVGKAKNKERISIKLNSLSNYSNYLNTFNKAQTSFTYRMKELRDKRLVLVSDEEMVVLDSGEGIYITNEYTFTQ